MFCLAHSGMVRRVVGSSFRANARAAGQKPQVVPKRTRKVLGCAVSGFGPSWFSSESGGFGLGLGVWAAEAAQTPKAQCRHYSELSKPSPPEAGKAQVNLRTFRLCPSILNPKPCRASLNLLNFSSRSLLEQWLEFGEDSFGDGPGGFG